MRMRFDSAGNFRNAEISAVTEKNARAGFGRTIDVALCGGLAFVLSVVLSWILQPVPTLHDEFSYLLAGDTFASGRMANEAHPCWMHFESMHILQKPRYASKYPPMQGLFLAAGQLVTHRPLAGVWFSTALAAASICWMLQGWLPRRWALLGGLVAVFHGGLQLTWGQSYMGGAPAVVGSALLYGALPRWQKNQSWGSGVAAAAGLAILANSRPFEGLLVSLPIVVVVANDLARQMRRDRSKHGMTALIPGVCVLVLTAAAMLLYNRQVTGSCLQLPYSLHSRQYMSGPLFVWQSPPSRLPAYHNAVMKEFHSVWELDAYAAQRTIAGFLSVKSTYFSDAMFVLLNPLTLLAVILGIRIWLKSGQTSLNVVMVALPLLILGASSAVWVFPHYLAPGLPLLLILAIYGIRSARIYLRQTRTDQDRIVKALAVAYLLMFAAQCAGHIKSVDHPWSMERERIITDLEQQSGKDLIIVQYAPQHSPHEEWVYNGANIDDASVVWARDLGAGENSRLIRYFRDRKIWTLAADSVPATLVPVEVAGITQTATGSPAEFHAIMSDTTQFFGRAEHSPLPDSTPSRSRDIQGTAD